MAGNNGYQVTTDDLRTDANAWEQQAEQMGAVVSRVNELKMDRVQAGIFQLAVSPYVEVIQAVQERSQEGQKAMNDIAGGLRQVAANYEHQEQSHVASFRNIGSGMN
ncbi:type VII secretion target [Streptacidiphilus fuscans]|uniref:Excreted virulence factor EspC (Type VII ESX diderm) n=1 Tax=Streptacidiphilus fuscans TaxID=2789292 RepID=A0A931FIF2_9ACTN|nr:type VII secretion target [Streptacidiphilus fuscans]MBF9071652.1 hypothetical protein [Streptacidiphilus fuscans]MBF9072861.1 hypothetical protein [Streptacidiphilus fuscans]